ncbi:hypothetical protein EEL30_00455 (plasmid) [Brevibacillus laterosporus]|uniref:Uncharacterized protein n=1 Tax=Brevibacillus laterosporus TaxID=1465 RepID=A0A518V1W3_BRELA|nr:hypothetical protein EEL30_00455 [Brevibacillus laterosporus]
MGIKRKKIKKEREERMKEIMKGILTTVNSEEEQRLQDTQTLLNKLSPKVLGMHGKAGEKIMSRQESRYSTAS